MGEARRIKPRPGLWDDVIFSVISLVAIENFWTLDLMNKKFSMVAKKGDALSSKIYIILFFKTLISNKKGQVLFLFFFLCLEYHLYFDFVILH